MAETATEQTTEQTAEVAKVESVEAPTADEKMATNGAATDPISWMNKLGKGATKKVAYQVLNWVNTTAEDDESKRTPTPGAKKESTSPKQFTSFLQDGSVLAKLANKLQPGSIETVHEGDDVKDKEKQTDNINNFISFLKDKAGLSDGEVFSATDLQEKGAKGFSPILGTLTNLATQAFEKFNQNGLDSNQLVEIANQAVKSGLIQRILAFFNRSSGPAQKKEVEEKKESNGETIKKEEVKSDAALPVQDEKQPDADIEKPTVDSTDTAVQQPVAVQ